MRLRPAATLAAALLAALPAAAWDSKGHNVVEALAYRSLVEGRDGLPPRADVIRDLVNDGALVAPYCFGEGASRPECRAAAVENPLLCWPQPQTDRPDAAFRRQFSDPGQCFHFMATLDDAQTDPLAGSTVPRALATTAVVRCRDLADNLLRQIVVDGGPGTRKSGYGLYELAHAVGDSFSGAHVERDEATGAITFLKVWQPIERLARLPTERAKRIPPEAYHVWDDHRDKAFVEERVVDGRACRDRVDHPYDVPYECLSPLGDRARVALVELYTVVRDLRAAHLAAPAADPAPERSAAWVAYKAKWFEAAHACEGAECATRQPEERTAGGDFLLGLESNYGFGTSSFDVTARGELLRFSEALNPFVYGLALELGYGKESGSGGFGLAGVALDLHLPVGRRAAIGLTPVVLRARFGGGDQEGAQVLSRLLRFQLQLGERTWISLNGPLQFDWLTTKAEWSVGAALSVATGSARVAGGPVIRLHDEAAATRDGAWVPPPAPYGRLAGRRASLFLASGVTHADAPEERVEGRRYGLGTLGADVAWARDRWDGRFVWVPALSLAVGARATSGEFTYVTGVASASIRWYALGPLGLSLTPVRVEAGPKTAGKGGVDHAPDVHGADDSQYYLQAGSRLGVVLSAGIVDFLVEGPTLAWRSDPFNTGEVLSVRLGIRIN